MVCPYCNKKSQVTNSRNRAKNTQVWRRRQCLACRKIWSTHEHIDMTTSHLVKGVNSRLEPFSRDILFLSIKDSLQHRKSSTNEATALTSTVLALVLRQNQAELSKSLIAQITHQVLANFDTTAAAVYAAKHGVASN